MRYLLLLSVFIIATCGLIYELVAGTLASYLLGDSVTQFSTVIGTYLFSMGIGSFLSRYVVRNLISVFIRIEILIGLIGGFSAALLFLLYTQVDAFRFLLYAQVVLTGILVGLEIPILMRILKDKFEFKDLVSQIFTFDYIGALAASLLFPMILVPQLGLIRTSIFFGFLNVAVALWAVRFFREEVRNPLGLQVAALLSLLALGTGFYFSSDIQKYSETAAYPGTIIHATSSPYQRIVLSRNRDDLRLYLNGNLQFSSRDEYRYHEALVHPMLGSVAEPHRVLVLGGGDGLAIREILKDTAVQSVQLVDLDPEMTRLFSTRPELTALNGDAFHDPRVTVTQGDAFQWLRSNERQFDLIIVDFPDPSNFSLGKLYSLNFYRELGRALAPGGAGVIQSTSPFFARKSFWCIDHTVREAGFKTQPYHCYLPSFGEWGFVGFYREPHIRQPVFPAGLKFVDRETYLRMKQFPPDMSELPTEVNRLDNQVLVQYFEEEWGRYVE